MTKTLTPAELSIFLKLAATGSFSETAILLGTSQPALSRKMALIEERIGTRLFDRHPRRVELTPTGRELKPLAERLLAEFDLGFRDLEHFMAGNRGCVKIAVLPSTVGALVIPAVMDCKTAGSEIDIVMRDLDGSQIVRDVADGQTDIGISVRMTASPDILFTPLLLEDVTLACSVRSPLAAAREQPWDVFAKHPMIAFSRDTSIRQIIDRALAHRSIDATPVYECDQLVTTGNLVASGLGITALPKLALASMGRADIVGVPLSGPAVHRELMVVTRIGRSMSPAARLFLKALRTRARRLGSPGQ